MHILTSVLGESTQMLFEIYNSGEIIFIILSYQAGFKPGSK